jgi:hypothetical protein
MESGKSTTPIFFLSPLWADEAHLEKAFSNLLKAFSKFVTIHQAAAVLEDSYYHFVCPILG